MKAFLHLMTCTALMAGGNLAWAADQASTASMTVPVATVEAATALPSVTASQQGKKTVLISPRTGMRYSFDNPTNRPINFKTQVLAPANAQTVGRISASNPALSTESQQLAQQALLGIEQAQPAQ